MASLTSDLNSLDTAINDVYSITTNTTNNNINNKYSINSYATDIINMTHQEIQEYLERLQNEELQIYIPVLVFVIFLAVFGFFGNVLVLVVYKYRFPKTPTRVFIMTIALLDALANVVSAPSDVYEIFNLWTYSTPIFCHVIRYIMAFITTGSAGVLLPLCITRYLKICRPFGQQVTTRHAQWASTGCIILATLVSIPNGVLNGLRTRPTPHSGVVGHKCGVEDIYLDTVWPAFNNGLYLLLFLCAFIPILVLYVLIGTTAYRHMRGRGKPITVHVKYTNTNMTSCTLSLTEDSEDKKMKRQVDKFVYRSKENRHETSNSLNTTFDSNTHQSFYLKDDEDREHFNSKLKPNAINEEQVTASDVEGSAERSVKTVSRSPLPAKIVADEPACRNLFPQSMSKTDNATQQKSANCFLCVNDERATRSRNGQDKWENKNETKVVESLKIESRVVDDNSDNVSEASFEEIDYSTKSMSNREQEEFNIISPMTCLEVKGDKEDNKSNDSETNDESVNSKDMTDETKRLQTNYTESANSETEAPQVSKDNWQLQDLEIKSDVKKTSGVKKTNESVGRKTTCVLALITLIFFFSYVPYLGVQYFWSALPGKFNEMGSVAQTVCHILHRTYMISSSTNAVIYSFCVQKFRKEAINLFRRKKSIL